MDQNTIPSREELEVTIKAAKWDRSSYEYALNHMLPHRYFNDSSIYLKKDLVELFYETVKTKWNNIKSFSTFKNL